MFFGKIFDIPGIPDKDGIAGPVGNPLKMLERLGGPKIPNPVDNIAKSLIDNVFRDKVFPVPGSVVWCKIGLHFEHTGIYIGNDNIVHLDGSGMIINSDPDVFISRLNGFNPAISIYVSCDGTEAVGSAVAAERAKRMINCSRSYNLIFDNCHQFTSGCLTGNFENGDNFFTFIEMRAKKILGLYNWRVWDR